MVLNSNKICELALSGKIMEAVVALVEGNPGATRVIVEMMNRYESIDPLCAFGKLEPIFSFAEYMIRGPQIWMLFKDVCGESIEKTIFLLRAVQLGELGLTELKAAIENHGQGIDVDALCTKIKDILKEAQKKEKEGESNG